MPPEEDTRSEMLLERADRIGTTGPRIGGFNAGAQHFHLSHAKAQRGFFVPHDFRRGPGDDLEES